MNRVRTILIILAIIALSLCAESFANSENLVYKILMVLIFQICLSFSLYLHYYLAQLDIAEELDKNGKFIMVKFFHKKRLITSLVISGMISLFVIIVSYTIGFEYITDLFDEEDLFSIVSIVIILTFLLLFNLSKYFSKIIYRYLK